MVEPTGHGNDMAATRSAVAGTARPGDVRGGELLRHFIAVCVDEFYAGHPPGGGLA